MTEETHTAEIRLVEKLARSECEKIFNAVPPAQWQSHLLNRLQTYNHVTEEEIVRAEELLEDIDKSTDLETFTTRVLHALQPLVDYIKADPKAYQAHLRAEALNDPETEKIKLNELLYYYLDKDQDMHLHVFPNSFTTDGEKLRLLREGLTKLSAVLQKDEMISKIHANSWIVAENPKLMKILGFTVTGKVNPPESSVESRSDDREVWHAVISRDDFLAKHLK